MNTSSFFSYLERRAESDTSVVAALRRSLTRDPGTDPNVYPLVESWTAQLNNTQRQIVYLAAGLWALAARRTSTKPKPLAVATKSITSNTSTAKRFTQLLDSDSDELVWRLRQLISLLNSTGTAVDWPQLLDDLLAWNRPSRSVQTRWARQFWG